MVNRGMVGLAVAAWTLLSACADPVGPADRIAGEYELAARFEDSVQTPVGPADDGAVLVLRPDRTWVLTRRRGSGPPRFEGFGLTDRYRFETDSAPLALSMFSEGPFLQVLAGSATIDGDTLRWGPEIFVRR